MNTHCKLSLVILLALSMNSCSNNGGEENIESIPYNTSMQEEEQRTKATVKRACWQFGYSLGLASFLHAMNEPYEEEWEKAKAIAKAFNIDLFPLPPRTVNKVENLANVVNYIMSGGLEDIVDRLKNNVEHEDEYAAIFELGIKSTVLLYTYTVFGSSDCADLLETVAQRARIPRRVWGKTYDLMASGASMDTVARSILEMADEIDQYYVMQIPK